MKIRIPDYFEDFVCIASQCEDTCCAGWEIVIDDESYNYYENLNNDFGKILRKNIKSEDGENTFILKGERCSFLSTTNTCDIYSNIGKDKLCYTCEQYPRYKEEFLDLQEQGLSLSCPEAARIILKEKKKIIFQTKEIDQSSDEDDNYIDKKILGDFLMCRDIIMGFIEEGTLSLEDKCNIVLHFVKEVQNKIDLGDMDEIKDVINNYKDHNFLNKTIKALRTYKKDKSKSYEEICEYFRVYKGLKQINTEDSLGLDKALKFLENNKELYISKEGEFDSYYKEDIYKFKNLLIYFIFRYFMKGIYDYDLSAKIKIAVISMLMIKELATIKWIENNELDEKDIVKISYRYSKNIEHSDENIEDIQEIFETREIFEVSNIISLLNS